MTLHTVDEEHGVEDPQFQRFDPEQGQDQVADHKRLTLAVITTQRQALLDARNKGSFSADTLNAILAILDADQISLELKRRANGLNTIDHRFSSSTSPQPRAQPELRLEYDLAAGVALLQFPVRFVHLGQRIDPGNRDL